MNEIHCRRWENGALRHRQLGYPLVGNGWHRYEGGAIEDEPGLLEPENWETGLLEDFFNLTSFEWRLVGADGGILAYQEITNE